ncbi:hypothetical protein INS49_003918 [Diaporthe citri]|uniref:uncharacterized protein n=1 Tax=Diaporthe citri TaxID=83186 RepID=UPI001C7F2FD8|nr:uncharacterized protein INS49_003918 [Diaporthe citri]KAG6354837.1 hypothetical protein INS49_003918 [Diaporthe citri]
MSSQKALLEIPAAETLAITTSTSIKEGDLPALRAVLSQHPDLATALITSPGPDGQLEGRTLLHIATDWPGHFPNVASTIQVLASAGADVSAPFRGGAHEETPLHWAASTDDIEALDALLAGGASIEASGSVLGGGPPLANAVGFRQWRAARRLVEHGAAMTLAQAAGLGLTERVEAMLSLREGVPPAGEEAVSRAFWYACHGGRLDAARILARHGADVNWRPPWDGDTRPLDAAREEGGEELVGWLQEQGAVMGRGNDCTPEDEKAPAR